MALTKLRHCQAGPPPDLYTHEAQVIGKGSSLLLCATTWLTPKKLTITQGPDWRTREVKWLYQPSMPELQCLPHSLHVGHALGTVLVRVVSTLMKLSLYQCHSDLDPLLPLIV